MRSGLFLLNAWDILQQLRHRKLLPFRNLRDLKEQRRLILFRRHDELDVPVPGGNLEVSAQRHHVCGNHHAVSDGPIPLVFYLQDTGRNPFL